MCIPRAEFLPLNLLLEQLYCWLLSGSFDCVDAANDYNWFNFQPLNFAMLVAREADVIVVVLFANMFDKRNHMNISKGNLTKHAQ